MGADAFIVAPVGTLVAIGLVMIFSASSVVAVAYHHDAGYYLKRQVAWLAVAIASAYVAYRIDYRKLRQIAPIALGLNIVGLILVLVPHIGTLSGGATRWLGVGSVQFEPSEFAKLTLVMYLATALAVKGPKIRSLVKGVFPLAFVAGVVAVLVVKQPDFGTASLLALTTATMLYVDVLSCAEGSMNKAPFAANNSASASDANRSTRFAQPSICRSRTVMSLSKCTAMFQQSDSTRLPHSTPYESLVSAASVEALRASILRRNWGTALAALGTALRT